MLRFIRRHALYPFPHAAIRLQGRMRKLILVLVLLPTVAIAAEPQKKKAVPVVGNPCAQYGDGFVQVKGTNTCIKASGSVQIDVGVQSGPVRR
jgi:hypothetical protein